MLIRGTISKRNSMSKKQNSVKNNILTDEEIRNIVKYNPDGREIKDQNYVSFLIERYKDRKNISKITTDTQYIESIKNKTKKDKKKDLYKKINDKEFKSTKKLKDENGNIKIVNLNLTITITGLNESFNKGYSDEKYAIVPYLDQIIKTSENGIVRNEAKKRDNIEEWYYLYNTAEINGQLYGVKVDIKKTGQGDRFYVHRVNLIKNEGKFDLTRTPLEMEKSPNNFPSSMNSISQKQNSVKENTIVNNKSTQKNKNQVEENLMNWLGFEEK